MAQDLSKVTRYRVADFDLYIGIALPTVLSSKYAPFRVEKSTDADTKDAPLFTLTRGTVPPPPLEGGYRHLCDNGTEWTFFPHNGGYTVRLHLHYTGRTCLLAADKTWRNVVTDCQAADSDDAFALDNVIMLAFTIAAAFRHAVLIHASCVCTANGDGVAFIGHSGAGKSTHSRLWLQHVPGCTLLNDDQPAVRLQSDGTPYIYGTPWSGKGNCYKQQKGRLRALFLMEQAPENRLERLSGAAAFAVVLSAAAVVREMLDAMQGVLDTVAAITLHTSVGVLRNRPEAEAVALSAGVVKQEK